MADNQLTTTSGSSETQTATQSPQSAPATSNIGNQAASSLQSSAASSLQGGVQISGVTSLSNVRLSNAPPETSTKTSTTSLAPVVKPHHFNPALLSFSGIFLVLAVAMFVIVHR